MDQSVIETDDMYIAFQQWCEEETDLINQKQQALRQEKKEIEHERRVLECEKREFSRIRESETSRLEKEKRLFEMKWKILEEELHKLASEKQQVEKQRRFYQYVSEYEKQEAIETAERTVRGDMFFAGVQNKQALKKRYKELIKIYHPDNLAGDVGTIQEINREYDRLQAQYT